MAPMDFGDVVRIRSTPETAASGHADRLGTCYGFTTPSVTGVDVIGPANEDYAIAVGFDDGSSVWFDPSLIAFVDVDPGQVARVGGHTYVRAPNGEWIEAPQDPRAAAGE